MSQLLFLISRPWTCPDVTSAVSDWPTFRSIVVSLLCREVLKIIAALGLAQMSRVLFLIGQPFAVWGMLCTGSEIIY